MRGATAKVWDEYQFSSGDRSEEGGGVASGGSHESGVELSATLVTEIQDEARLKKVRVGLTQHTGYKGEALRLNHRVEGLRIEILKGVFNTKSSASDLRFEKCRNYSQPEKKVEKGEGGGRPG